MTDDDEDYRIIDYQWVPKVSEVDMAHRWLPEQAAAIRETRQRVVEQLGAASWQRLAARKQPEVLSIEPLVLQGLYELPRRQRKSRPVQHQLVV